VVANEPREQDNCVVATLGGLALGVFLDDEVFDVALDGRHGADLFLMIDELRVEI